MAASYPPVPPGPPYGYMPPRPDHTALIVVVVIIVVIAAVALPAILYVMVSGLIGGPNPTGKPTVTLTVTKITVGVSILVAGIEPPVAPSNFKVNIQNTTSSAVGTAVPAPTSAGGSASPTCTAPSCAQVSVSGVTFSIVWNNPGGSGMVSQGDTFVIIYSAAAGTQWAFLLIWADGSVLPINATWQT